MIGIVDYDIGNLRSVQKAFQHVGGEAVFVRTPEEIARVDALVLPGVGAFGDCVRSLAKSGMWDATLAWAQSGEKPFFGICVGYQMLFESSEEAPGEKGLGLFAGTVRKFSDKHGLKIPQIGWNTVAVRQPDAPLLAGIADGDYVYFVHSYYVTPKDASLVALETTYGDTFAAAVARGNLIATQFHPEKSQRAGLRLLTNFVELAKSAKEGSVAGPATATTRP
jgi:glutamine amidotransferase